MNLYLISCVVEGINFDQFVLALNWEQAVQAWKKTGIGEGLEPDSVYEVPHYLPELHEDGKAVPLDWGTDVPRLYTRSES